MTCVHTFEIKIAIIGNVSAGKTTILNALFRDKYSQVSMKRTTAGVNYFRIFSKGPKLSGGDGVLSKNANEIEKEDWSVIAPDEPLRTAESTLLEITKDNVKLRALTTVQEKTFDVELPEDLFEMRHDTQLVFVDIPGINEAGSSEKYKTYIKDKWATFDCVVLVMDARHGVNTEDQVALLEFAKKMCDEKRLLPIIVLCNKVDDPEDEELCSLLKEIHDKMKEIFLCPVLEKEQIFDLKQKGIEEKSEARKWPIFVPLGAIQAYAFRCGLLMSFEQFKEFDKELVEKIGRERLGRQHWRKVANKVEGHYAVYELIIDNDNYQAAIRESNFDTFLTALELLVGGKTAQHHVIARHLDFQMDQVSSGGKIAATLYNLFRMRESLGGPGQSERVSKLDLHFWRLYDEKFTRLLGRYDSSPQYVSKLVELLDELQEMGSILERIGATEMQNKIRDKAEALVRGNFGTAIGHFQRQQIQPSQQSQTDPFPWFALTAVDWSRIIRNILQVSHHPLFWARFGREIRELELMYNMTCSRIIDLTRHYTCGKCPSAANCDGELDFNRRCVKCCLSITFQDIQKSCEGNCTCYVDAARSCCLRNGILRAGTSYCSSCGASTMSRSCSKCSSYWNTANTSNHTHNRFCKKCVVDSGKISAIAGKFAAGDRFYCIQCNTTPLDSNRMCNECKVTYCLPGSLTHGKCPNRSSDTFCNGTLSKFGQCDKCRNNFRELSGSLESLLTFKHVNGKKIPDNPDIYEYFVGLEIPCSLSDPMHFGHLAWKSCTWMESIQSKE